LTAADQLWKKHVQNSNNASVIVTTESKIVMNDATAIQRERALLSSLPVGIEDIITNHLDVLPDTGFLQVSNGFTAWTADDAMVSALTSLKLQLMANVTALNCCSNFHLVLADLLSEGCGASPVNSFSCLQDHPDPKYRIRCSWDKQTPANTSTAISSL
jgi:hypothetical protein